MENVDKQIKYMFRKSFVTDSGTIPEGTEIILFRGWVYVNGGMADEYSRKLIMNIVNDPAKNKEYLVRMKLIPNKV